MLSFCHEMLSLKNLVSAIVTCTCRDFVGRARACEKDTKRSENSRRECYRIAVSDRLIRDEARIRNLIHADRPRIRINPFAPKSPLLNFDRLSPLRLAFIFTLQRLPSNFSLSNSRISRFPSLFRVICIRARGALIAQFPVTTSFPVADDNIRVSE